MTIAPERDDAVSGADEAPPTVLDEPDGSRTPASITVDPVALKHKSLELVQRAIEAGSVEVALQYLALDAQWSMQRRRRRRGWIIAAASLLLLFALFGGLVAYQGLQAGNTGENAPEPLGFGDAPTVPLDQGATGSSAGDSAAGAPTDAAEVLGASQDAPLEPPVAGPAISAGVPAATTGAPRAGAPAASGTVAAGATSGGAVGAPPPSPGTPQTTAPRAPTPGPAPTTAPPTTAPPTTLPVGGALDGSWSVIGGSQAGYRVSKRWTLTGADEVVVGRTARVSGSMTVAQDRVTATSVIIDMASVDSANGIRDAAYRQDILDVASHPTSRFDLTGPIGISGRPAPGTVFTTTATGQLQIRGVTRQVTVQIQGRQNGGTIQVVGSIPVTFSDFGISAPNLPIVTVANQGTIEFQVNLSRG